MRQLRGLMIWIVLGLMVGSVGADSPQQSNIFQDFLFDTRLDLELLADRVYAGVRPEEWNGNADFTQQSFLADLWFDNELLADEVFGAGIRSEEWIGATTRNLELISRNIRHDLELSADNFLSEDTRPDGWTGAAPVYRCSRTIQNILYTLAIAYGVRPNTPDGVLDFCTAVSIEIDDELISGIQGQSVSDEATDFQGLIWAVRGDLERLADETQGLGNRPPSWIGNTDLNSPDLADDTLSDMERLADTILGLQIRPEGWNGTISSSLSVSYRSLRQDIELLADAAPNIGEGVRPNGWQGVDTLIRCSSDIQNLVVLLQQTYQFAVEDTIVFSASFCTLVEEQANNFAENPPIDVTDPEESVVTYEAVYAFAYLDQAALEFMGIVPEGIEFRAWYRNFNGSTMMFVSGENFAVYMDRRWTTMPQEAFDRLPTLEGVIPLAFCDATWCNGPAPTPTPTGGGALFDIVNGVTAPAPLEGGEGGTTGGEGKTQVSWNNIRINYLLQRPEVGTAQVTLEICNDTSQVACEPVISVFDNNTGIAVSPVSQFNGLNVYELPYGYSTNYLVEGSTLFSNDIWLNDPTLLTPQATTDPAAVTSTPAPTSTSGVVVITATPSS